MPTTCTNILTLTFLQINRAPTNQIVDHRSRHYGCRQLNRCDRLSRSEILRESSQWTVERLLRHFIGIGGQHAYLYGSFIEEWAARTKANCHIANETGAQSIWKSTENTTDSTDNKCTARPSTNVGRTNARRQFQWAARFTGTSAAYDDAKWAARRLSAATHATAEYAGRNGTKPRSTTHAGNSLYWTLRKWDYFDQIKCKKINRNLFSHTKKRTKRKYCNLIN